LAKSFGYLLWISAGILGFIFWLIVMSKWLGFLGTVWLNFFGTVLGIVLAFILIPILISILIPGFVIFPLVFWIVEGVFPAFYFMVWGISIVGAIIVGILSKDE